MLFLVFVTILIIGIICLIVYTNTNNTEWLSSLGIILTIVGIIAVCASAAILVGSYCGLDGYIEENKARYESLTYQYENDIYNNDNDIGKKELMNEIREWNEDLARYKENQDDFWIGIFIPNIYDQFEFIEYK